MLSFNKLGKSGRLGNQMFQYASLRGIAANRGFDWVIPPPEAGGIGDFGEENNYCMFDTFKMSHATKEHQAISNTQQWAVWKEFHFNEKLFNECPDNVNLDGYFQSEKYFKNVEKEIREDFIFQDEILNPCKEMIDSLGDGRKIFLHIRRGDPKLQWAYVNLQNAHPLQTWDYYEKALAEFPDDIPVIVFSDDPAWCHEQDLFQDDRFMISENESGYIDQCLMSMCSDFIIANSSFSWWAAWLGNRGKVIAPKKWFPDDKHNLKDLYCKGWKVI